jgi:hypothetical protein
MAVLRVEHDGIYRRACIPGAGRLDFGDTFHDST